MNGKPSTARSRQEQAAVNGLSSHIDVTPSRAVVTYSWGNFKHDPLQVLARYFDAFIYLANWGSKRLAFRFPASLLDRRQIEPYLWEYYIRLRSVGGYLILDISLDDEEGGGWIEGEGRLSSLSRLRDDILHTDHTCAQPWGEKMLGYRTRFPRFGH